ncbi:MAG: HAD-IIA family hydrolase [Acidimicrobiia bacterium]
MIDVICDLDGVIYRGNTAIPGAKAGLELLATEGARICFVTNNSTRTPAEVASKIRDVVGVGVDPDRVVTSSQAAVGMLEPDDDPVLVVGEGGILDALSRAGFTVTVDPGEARSVMVGLYRDLTYETLEGASSAIRGGARFVATNTDPTFPIQGGLKPGAGSIVAAIATASQCDPEIAGKPHTPMRAIVRQKVGAQPWVVGDRVDTDIAMASLEAGWRSILVLSGVTSTADEGDSADFVVEDFEAAAELVLASEAEQ